MLPTPKHAHPQPCQLCLRVCVPLTNNMWRWLVGGAAIAAALLTFTVLQPSEVQHQRLPLDSTLASELNQLRRLLGEQQAAGKRQAELLLKLQNELRSEHGAPAALLTTAASTQSTAATTSLLSSTPTDAVDPALSVRKAARQAERNAAALAQAEAQALSHCTEADVPILALLRKACPDGMHGYDCDVRWGLDDSFLPTPRRWLDEWNARTRAVVNCQRGFFDALTARFTRAHWEVEWDAQPFRIAAVPPRTIGKMIHQIVTANYFHLTLPPSKRPPLRQSPLPGWSYLKTTQPGFRWNVLDYGADNVFADPLSSGDRCKGASHGAWHCIWQRFPQQTSPRTPPPRGSPLDKAAHELYNLSMTGRRERSMLQYLLVSGVSQVFSEPTDQTRDYLRDHLKLLCHVAGPHCGGTPAQLATPVAAIHVRRGDSCDRERDEKGPFNSMFAWNAKKGAVDRVGFRYCYTWKVYLEQLKLLQRMYGVRTVLLATDDADGVVTARLPQEKGFNWAYLHYPRKQFKKRGWMEFRKDLTDDVPFSLAAALELLGSADVLVGNMGSHVTRMMYNKMVSSAATSQLPPFISVDGYGLCCDFTEECSKEDIRKRDRSIRDCIHKYGQCTGGDQFFRWRG